MFIPSIEYLIFLSPAFLLMAWAQWRIKSTYANALKVPAKMTGAEAARSILDAAGLQNVDIEPVHGQLSDHYDPSHRVLRLSEQVYFDRTAASVGIAAHEAGHALQHAQNYGPLVIRNLAVPAAQFGPMWFLLFFFLGMFIPKFGVPLMLVGIAGYGAVAVFQLINLPVEFDASNRAKRLLSEMGIVDSYGSDAVASVLNAAAWTYVAATLQSILIVAYYLLRVLGTGGRDD
ncbi:zinc metallopeptidase [Thalassoglobus sp. JC818]|uniref:zinc metallopeptidase n=1 Tax=Thalassoglobus sp. JC818 TaxID=3232136 RepID=UPI0034580ADE